MGIIDEIEAECARERPGIILARRNIALAFQHWYAGRISTLVLFEVIDRYGTDGDAMRASTED
jgi:hypothetical protein